MRYLLTLLLLCSAGPARAQQGAFWDLGRQAAAAAGASCTLNYTLGSTAGTLTLGDSAAKKFVALSNYVNATSFTLCQVDLWLRDYSSPGTLTVKMFGNSSTNTPGTLLATSTTTIDNSMTTTTLAWVACAFSGGLTLTNATTYWVVLEISSASGVHYYGTTGGANGSGHALQSDAGVHWSLYSTRQPYFSVYKQ
jgi:hypothetical protein